MLAISLTVACSRHTYEGVILPAHPVRGESHNQRNTTGDVATAPFFELVSQIISCAVLDRMLWRHLETQHAQMKHGLQSMRQFALKKCVLISTMTSLKTKLIVCGTKERRDVR